MSNYCEILLFLMKTEHGGLETKRFYRLKKSVFGSLKHLLIIKTTLDLLNIFFAINNTVFVWKKHRRKKDKTKRKKKQKK